jgi:colicin import membrane protein
MIAFFRQHWIYLVGALLLHALFAGIFGLTLIQFTRNAPPPQLAIQAVVVDESMLRQASRPPRQQREEQEKQAAQQREREQAEEKRRQEEEAKRESEQRVERERQAEQQRRDEEQQRQLVEEKQLRERQEQQRRQEAEAQKKREAEAERQRKAEAERKRVEEIKQRQEEEAKKRRAAEEAKAQAAREEELRRQLEDEEGVMEARGSTAMAQYVAQIRQHVERRWIRPPSARPGLDCEIKVVQAPGGSVLSAQVTRCNGDAAVRQSIETAVLRSSPLPPPSDPRLFERTLLLQFKPQLD